MLIIKLKFSNSSTRNLQNKNIFLRKDFRVARRTVLSNIYAVVSGHGYLLAAIEALYYE